jgi:hypothetical protein
VRFANGGKSFLVSDATDHELVPTLVDLADGHPNALKRIQTDAQDRSLFVATPDRKYYAYSAPLFSSNLYIVDNLRWPGPSGMTALFASGALIGYHLFKLESVNSRNVYPGLERDSCAEYCRAF